jgi:hypothetical protein
MSGYLIFKIVPSSLENTDGFNKVVRSIEDVKCREMFYTQGVKNPAPRKHP